MPAPPIVRTDLLAERLLHEGADPISCRLWLALFRAHREAREVLSTLYELGRPDTEGCAQDLGVLIREATLRTPIHISRSEESMWHDLTPVPTTWSRRDFQAAGATFKVLSRLACELGPEGCKLWVNPNHPPVDFDSIRAPLVDALLECEEPMRAYTKLIHRQKAMEKLGAQSERW